MALVLVPSLPVQARGFVEELLHLQGHDAREGFVTRWRLLAKAPSEGGLDSDTVWQTPAGARAILLTEMLPPGRTACRTTPTPNRWSGPLAEEVTWRQKV
ncbi:unnamed protein product [Polarella glacialis]|uniref:Uncharacterized protein n=1 Tax=Polarella glacialis TaxID=89957 RepID=A0A813HRQ3_POLGL|nr:unnamed protein product [Polarella glacialis]